MCRIPFACSHTALDIVVARFITPHVALAPSISGGIECGGRELCRRKRPRGRAEVLLDIFQAQVSFAPWHSYLCFDV